MMTGEAYHTNVRTSIRLVTLLARLFLPLSYGGIDLHTIGVHASAASPARRALLARLAWLSRSIESLNVHTSRTCAGPPVGGRSAEKGPLAGALVPRRIW